MPIFDNIPELKEAFQGVDVGLQWAIFIVACLIVLVALVSSCVAIWLAIKYIVYNRRMNSKGITGADAARQILDKNGLQKIKVSTFGSLLFGNSYSHYFKKVRIRRLTNKKPSITSLAIGAQKASLAILDKEGDKDMKTRIILTPIMYFGPFAFIPLIVVGVILDFLIFGSFKAIFTVTFAGIGILFYVVSFVLSLMVLKTEVKAQKKAVQILKEDDMATEEEINMMKELFKLYNIQYVNDLILEFLQMLLKILQFVAKIQGNSSSNSSN